MASNFAGEKFDQEQGHSSVLEAFKEFVSQFGYSYDALSRDPPSTMREAAQITAWRTQDQRKVFLGKYCHRNMQKLYEELTTRDDRDNMTFNGMIRTFSDRFRLSTNLSLANYKFRKLMQEQDESFEAFTIRVKREASNCDFKCNEACTVIHTMVRDQILFGTRDTEIQKNALKDQWTLEELSTKGRAIEASGYGATAIKQEPPEEVKRTKPGRYSKKYSDQKKWSPRQKDSREDYKDHGKKCKNCSSTRCDSGKRCPAVKVTCFSCGNPGHFRGAEACKKKFTRKSRRVDEGSSTEGTSGENTSGTESEYQDSSDGEADGQTGSRSNTNMRRVLSKIPTIRRIGGRRRSNNIRKTDSRYNLNVIIMERKVPVFCDTGADICIMSKKNAQRIGLDVVPTSMKIRPYGARTKKCLGEAICTIRHNDSVANTKMYILRKEVETLLSGTICEELGIITLNTQDNNTEVRRTPIMSDAKRSLIKRFPSIFSGIGTLKDYKVKFFIDKAVPPVFQPARPIPFHLREKMDKELRKMEQSDVIEPHEGPAPWVSNVVLTPKDDGGTRLTIDMRCANKAIKKTNLPIPRPEEISSQLSAYTRYSKLDFASAFHQLELDEGSRRLTVFHANGKLMRYKRLTMGTAPASGELNKALRPIFQNIEHAHVIQDDLIVGGATQQDHDRVLDTVCRRIEEIGMTLNPDKCIISADKIPWWGMEISKDGVSPDSTKVDALKHMTPPKTRDEVKSLYCMLQSNKDFIPFLASKTSHIRVLLKKETKFVWSEECQREFDKIKREFSNDILLRHFDPSLKTEIQVDASQNGLSALLVQERDGGKRIVGVASRATTPVEQRYPQIDLEALAVDFGLRRYRFYIAGGPRVLIITDHKPLRSIFCNLRKGSIRTERIKLRHQDIDYEVKWEKGIDNPADYLSRHATPLSSISKDIQDETTELEKTIWHLQYSPYTEAVSIEGLIDNTNQDKTLRSLRKALRKGYLPESDKNLAVYGKVWDQLTISESGLILKGEKIILPEAMISTAIKKAHQGGHPGMTTMKRRLRAHFWCPQLNKRVQEMVTNCNECAMFTPKNRKNHLRPHKMKDFNAWEKVSIDLFGPMPDQRYILVAQDMVSKFPAAKIMTKTDASHVTAALDDIYAVYGTPMIHRSDNGPPFNSKEFESFSTGHGIHHEKSFPYHPQANPVETFMKPLGKCMKAAYSSRTDKQKALNDFLSTYRATPHTSTGVAPGDILFRHGYGHNFPRMKPQSDQEVHDALELDQETREQRDQERNLTRQREEFQVGDTVLTRNNGHTKFQPVFDPQPRTVTEVGQGGVICEDGQGTSQRRHQDDIKLAPTPHTPPQESQTLIPLEVLEPLPAEKQREKGKTRPAREKRPNPRLKDYVCY